MAKLWEKLGSAKDNSDLAEVDMSHLKITSPTVIYLPGKDQADGSPTELSKGINFVNKLFSDLPQPPKVYLYSHNRKYSGQKGNLSSIFRIAAYSYLPHFSTSPAKKLAKNVIMPLVTDDDGKPLPLDVAKQNLRNVTLLGYCLGSVAAQEVHNASMRMMKKAGFSKEDARAALREIVLVSFATFTRPDREDDRYTTVAFMHRDDLFINAKNVLVMPVEKVIDTSAQLATLNLGSEKLNIKPLSDTSLVVTASAREALVKSLPLQKKKYIINNVRLRRWNFLASNHAATDYISDADTSNQFSRMVEYALKNAVTRKDRARPIDLLNEPAGAERTPGYDDKIAAGLLEAANKPFWRKTFLP